VLVGQSGYVRRGGGHYSGKGHYGGKGHYYKSGGGHHHHHGSSFSTGIIFGPMWYPWGYPSPYYGYPSPYYYSSPPIVIERGPQEYIYQETQPAEPSYNYWYYCQDPEGYYPYVKRCPDGWMKVVPSTTPQDEED
jgi:hypothetical protein